MSAVTAAVVTKKQLFHKVGGFDEVYLNGCEDVDLCLRMAEMGLRHYVVHNSVVEHVKGASEGRKLFNNKNSEILLKRWKDSITCNQSVHDQSRSCMELFYSWNYKKYGPLTFINGLKQLGILLRLEKLKISQILDFA